MVGKRQVEENAKSSKQFPWNDKGENISSLNSSSPGSNKEGATKNGGKSESLRSPGTNPETTQEPFAPSNGGANPKKLANQLELLTEMFNDYVGAHQGRLEKRLEESRQFAQTFEDKLADLKQQITGSLSASEIE